jgi:MFS superfamily sulfate permease-like transporter
LRDNTLVADALTGVSVAGLLLPEAVAYSGLANLPPQAGVIGLFAGLLCYALIGRSPYAIVSATSSSAAVLAAATVALGGGTLEQRVALASLLVFGTGIAFLLAGCARLGAMSNLIARPVLRGFSFGLALVIAVKQWPHIAGMHARSSDFLPLLLEIFERVGAWHPTSVAVGVAALLALFLLERVRGVPGVLLVIVLERIGADRAIGLGIQNEHEGEGKFHQRQPLAAGRQREGRTCQREMNGAGELHAACGEPMGRHRCLPR